jgi:hypothetical protein
MLLMGLVSLLRRLLARDGGPGEGHDHHEGHFSEFSRPEKDATPAEAERRSEHLRRDRERREEGKRP